MRVLLIFSNPISSRFDNCRENFLFRGFAQEKYGFSCFSGVLVGCFLLCRINFERFSFAALVDIVQPHVRNVDFFPESGRVAVVNKIDVLCVVHVMIEIEVGTAHYARKFKIGGQKLRLFFR